ncbi:NUDIX hydrolase domain-like protein [Pseudoneurospora amorphoporcata]|uniref:NUDIX hydrolase domain-like protein n=1 Tax=Pseudoneurospora amorphoporcata TaxID=241081 RepID=A0AAN6NP65_9PEZI|nr:NUDIX hydrolase domain-like protein [Pseudoneurospora amorphoporcata]
MRNILTRYPALSLSSLASASSSASRTRALAAASNTNIATVRTTTTTTTTTTTKLIPSNAKRTLFKMTVPKTQEPTITSITELTPQTSKWLTLQQISYVDQTGKSRLWEVAARKTRSSPPSSSSSSPGIDAVAMCNIILHPSRPPSTLLVIQYRPPLDAYTIEWPAGLIDKGETPEQAAVREFKEETGYECVVKRISPVQAADPGMSSANMVMATVEVNLTEKDGEELPEQRLEDGEHITRVVVPIKDLYQRLVEYSRMERHVVAAKLFHFAEGMEFARTERYGVFGGGGGKRE